MNKSLSELIQDCGKIILFWEGEYWVAGTPDFDEKFCWSGPEEGKWIDDSMRAFALGATPEEAVGNLRNLICNIKSDSVK